MKSSLWSTRRLLRLAAVRLVAAWLTAAGLFGATSKSPANCSSRPCTYTITCAAANCTTAEVDEVQTAITDAQRGDTIKLQSGRTFLLGSSYKWKFERRSGDLDNSRRDYLTVTSTLADSLPDRTTRVSPHHVGLMATIRITGNYGMYFAGNSTPAAHIKLRGLHILNAGATQTVSIGNMNTRDGFSVTGYDQQPKGIWLEQCVIRAESMFDTSTQHVIVSADGRVYPSGLIGNWISFAWHKISAGYFGNETQLVYVHPSSTGFVHLVNNYVADCSGENVMLGGTGPPYRDPDTGISPYPMLQFINNSVMNHPERLQGKRQRGWTSSTKVFKGRVISEGGAIWMAQGSGTTGTAEPGWCATDGCTVSDNGITWRRYFSGAGNQSIKCLFESKTGSGLLMYNWFYEHPGIGQAAFVSVKLAHCQINGSTGCTSKPYISGRVDVSGTSVTSADGKPLPDVWSVGTNDDALDIKIGGIDYRIADFDLGNPNRLVLTTAVPSPLTNVNYEWGTSSNRPAGVDKDWLFAHNVTSEGNEGIAHIQQPYAMTWNTGQKAWIHNLHHQHNCDEWMGCSPVKGGAYFAFYSNEWTYQHNTYVDGVGHDESTGVNAPTVYGSGYPTQQYGAHFFRSNVMHKQQGGGNGLFNIAAESFLDDYMCKDIGGACTTASQRAVQNVFGGYPLGGMSTAKYGTTWNLCSGSAACDVNMDADVLGHGKLFTDWSKRILSIRPAHPAAKKGHDGVDVGASFVNLPMVRPTLPVANTENWYPTIRTNSTKALVEFIPHAPAASISCSIEVSSTEDMDNPVADLNGNNAPMASDNHDSYPREIGLRRILVGKNVALNPSTKYYYRLHCGGAIREGSFTTTSSSSGKTLEHSRTVPGTGQYRIAYGATYSRSTSQLTGGGSGEYRQCDAGTACSLSATLPAGVTWWRVEGPNGYRSPLEVQVN